MARLRKKSAAKRRLAAATAWTLTAALAANSVRQNVRQTAGQPDKDPISGRNIVVGAVAAVATVEAARNGVRAAGEVRRTRAARRNR